MWEWYRRRKQRKADLKRGVDADLVRDNWRRIGRGLAAIAVAFCMGYLTVELNLDGWKGQIVSVIMIGSVVYGLALLFWASEESAFLDKPDPKEPPSLFKSGPKK